MGIYNFNPEDVERFALSLGSKTRRKGSELEFGFCPYCHGGGKDKGTFSINMRTGQFECKRSSCGMKGNMITLARDFSDRFELSTEVTRYYNVDDFNSRFRTFKKRHEPIESKDAAITFLQSRGISEAICKKYGLTIKEGTEDVLVFPFYDQDENLRFIKYRNLNFVKGVSKGGKEWCEADCMPILFGMNHCTTGGTLVITEGQLDSLSLAEAGIQNAVSVPTGCNGFTWVPHCYDWVQKFNEVIVFGDFEKGKITLADDIQKRFPKRTKVVRKDDYLGCKDANEILQKYGPDALITAVQNAEAPVSSLIKKTNQIEKVDIENTMAIKTGFPELDRLLSGGFHEGQLIILTGKRGDGKSTLMSQFICEALQQNVPSFVYSGELVDFFFKNWIDRQLIGKHDITQSEEDAINRFYDDKLYLFNNSILLDAEEKEMDLLLQAIDEAIMQLAVKFICIDNLMTAIDLDPRQNTYEVQSKFVGDLANICRRHNVIIMLVAHPRKGNGWVTDENDEISGSADITNKADIVLRYERPKPDKHEDPAELPPRRLALIKNRLTGKTTGKFPIDLYFDEGSKRISDVKGKFDREYFNIDFVSVDDEEVPF